MSSMALDTHAYYKKLVATGLRDDQAEAIASGLVNGLTENLATKDELQSEIALLRSDMGAMEERLRGEMAAMEERLEGKIAIVRTDMADMQVKLMRYMTTLVLGSGGLIIAAMKLLP
jgi:hypothetical protein